MRDKELMLASRPATCCPFCSFQFFHSSQFFHLTWEIEQSYSLSFKSAAILAHLEAASNAPSNTASDALAIANSVLAAATGLLFDDSSCTCLTPGGGQVR